MALTDHYVVQHLVELTRAHAGTLIWRDDGGSFSCSLHGVEVVMDPVPSRSGDRIHLTLTYGDQHIFLSEPVDTGVFVHRYGSDDEASLALLFRQLLHLAARQCAERERTGRVPDAVTRNEILGRLLFGERAAPGQAVEAAPERRSA